MDHRSPRELIFSFSYANLKPWYKALPDLILCLIFLLQLYITSSKQERASFLLGKKLIKGEESANSPGKRKKPGEKKNSAESQLSVCFL